MAQKFVILSAFLFSLHPLTDSTITLQNNGYSGILVGIAEDVPQPFEDNGNTFIQDLKDLLTKSSEVLYRATNERVYFKDFDILLPRSWKNSIDGLSISITRDLAPNKADIRLVLADPVSGNNLPFTFHSGKCGVTGDQIEIPVDYLNYTIFGEDVTVKAKAIVQEWSKFRYGVFEEHGYPNDYILPYFYRHPDGYDALSSSNDTEIKGNFQNVNGGSCQVTNGVIIDQDECRFVPSSTDQTATSSLMSFYWLDSVVGFSEDEKHNFLAPHRQNRLCNMKSSWEVILSSDDIFDSPSSPGANTVPNFKLWRNPMEPVLYIAIDSSFHSAGNYIGLLKRELGILINKLTASNPDVYVGLATFKGEDNGQSKYVNELVAPIRVADGSNQLIDAINGITFDPSLSKRNVLAVFRDVLPKLIPRNELGGSFFYIATLKDTDGNDTYSSELDVSQQLIRHNIKLFVAETGDGRQSLGRLSALSDGYYLTGTSAGSTYPFPPITAEITKTLGSVLNIDRAMVVDLRFTLEESIAKTGSFLIDSSADLNTTAILQSPRDGLITVTLVSPSGQEIIFNNIGADDTNWFLINSTLGVASVNLTASGPVAGKWSYSITYDTSSCNSCPTSVDDILFQVSTSRNPINAAHLPKLDAWFSVEPGTNTADMSKSPLIVSARFDTSLGRVGGLDVRAEIIDESSNIKSIALYDTGSVGADIARDGIYSGEFIPEKDGMYAVNIMASQSAQWRGQNKIMDQDQEWFCCGTSVPTISVTNFYRMYSDVTKIDVVNAISSGGELIDVVNDLTSSTYGVDDGKVIINMMWTVPPYTDNQKVKYSDNATSLRNNIDDAIEATVVYGSVPSNEGAAVNIYVSAPYQENKNIYFAVQVTSTSGQTIGSNLAWADKNPPETPFTTKDPSATSSTAVTDTSTLPTTELTSPPTEDTIPPTTELTTFPTEETTLPITDETTLTSTEDTTLPITEETTPTSTEDTTLPTTELSTLSTKDTTLPTTEKTTPSTEDTTLPTTELSTLSTKDTTLPTTEKTTSTSTEQTTFITETTIDSSTDSTTTTTTPTTVKTSTTITSDTTTDSTVTYSSTTSEPRTTVEATEPSTSTENTTADSASTSPFISTPSTVVTEATEPSTSTDYATDLTVSASASSSSSDLSTVVTEATDQTAEPSPTTENSDNGNGLTGAEIGYIVGGAIGGLVVGGTVIGLIFYFKSKAISSSSFPGSTQPSSPPSGGYSQQPLAYQPSPRSAVQQSSTVLSPSYENSGFVVGDDYNSSRYQSSQKPVQDPYPPRQQRSNNQPQAYSNYGVTVEDDDTMLTAL